MRSYDLSPLMRTSVGFDRFDSLFDQMFTTANRDNGFPPYDIERLGEHDYRITMALAGYDQNDISIVLENGILTVKAQATPTDTDAKEGEEGTRYLHRGIARRAFEKRFHLDDTILVDGASFENGMLVIALRRELPERMKPRQIAINGGKTVEAHAA